METPFEPGFMRPTPPLHRVDDEVGVVMTIHHIILYVKVTWLNPAGGQFDIKWDVAMCSSQHHGNTNGNSSGGNHLQSMLTIMILQYMQQCYIL